jgi:DNA mismatch endonuclease (patch repair protein)
MADTLSKKRRSWNMSRIKGSNTKPENMVAVLLRKLGIKYRRNILSLPGRPDFHLVGEQKVVFVHGCFWHRHTCKAAATPSSNKGFWLKKFEANMRRDRDVRLALKKIKYKSLVLWECQVEKSETALKDRVLKFARKREK